MRIEPPAADEVPAWRWHLGPSEARQQRTSKQKRRANLLRELRLEHGRIDTGTAERQLVLAAPTHADTDPLEDLEHGIDIADSRDVPDLEHSVGQYGRGQDRQRRVLVAGRNHGAAKRRAAGDDEPLHGVGGVHDCTAANAAQA